MRISLPLPLTAATALIGGSRLYHVRRRDWGATPDERHRVLPGDELVPVAASVSTMAITIDAPPAAVWPWLVQMGVDRAGFYTHTWVENGLLRLGVRNADRIVPAWQQLVPGDRIRFMQPRPGRSPFGPTVARVEPERALILGHGDDPRRWAGTWQFVLEPLGHGTRLLLRTRSAPHPPLAMAAANLVLEPGYTYMDIGMLKGIRARAERLHRGTPGPTTLHGGGRRILVAVASMQGSTREVGEAIADELAGQGFVVDVLPMRAISRVDAYDAIVLGSAIHTDHWLREASRFVQQVRAGLKAVPTWLFSVGMLAVDHGAWPEPYPADLPKHLIETGARGHRLFLGRRREMRPSFLWTWVAGRFHLVLGDYRDWPAIRAWAREIGDELHREDALVARPAHRELVAS